MTNVASKKRTNDDAGFRGAIAADDAERRLLDALKSLRACKGKDPAALAKLVAAAEAWAPTVDASVPPCAARATVLQFKRPAKGGV